MLEPFLSRAYQRPAGRSEKAVNIGVVAHITAASPGGPRYDPDLLAEERSAAANGIWLCQNCAKLIDNDVVRFSSELLKAWKTTAEADAKGRVGRTSQSEVTLRNYIDVEEKTKAAALRKLPRKTQNGANPVTE
jgi:hypothetical protein